MSELIVEKSILYRVKSINIFDDTLFAQFLFVEFYSLFESRSLNWIENDLRAIIVGNVCQHGREGRVPAFLNK